MMYESLFLYYVTKHEVFVEFSELMKYKDLFSRGLMGDTQMMKIRRFHILRSVCAAILEHPRHSYLTTAWLFISFLGKTPFITKQYLFTSVICA